MISGSGRSAGKGISFGFLGGSEGKESACSVGDPIPGLGRSPGEGSGYPLQYSGVFKTEEPGGL